MKNSKIFLVVIMLVVALTLPTVLCACNDSGLPSEDKNAKDFEFRYYEFGARLVNYATIIKSVKDLSAFYEDTSSPIYKENEYDVNNKKTLEIFQDYDKQFFKNKSLVIIFRVRTCLGLDSDIKNYEIIDNTLNVTVSVIAEKDKDYATAMTMHLCLLEFDKEKLSNVTQINVEEIKEII
ncbi:MAG: hypothetical protein K2L70_06435 [Clostridia bacterium]|nr:hypothetical protein [Clostridia bacterium]